MARRVIFSVTLWLGFGFTERTYDRSLKFVAIGNTGIYASLIGKQI
jgi:hypothetical protein